ncbi:hypothetical protein [Streptomyces hydrogenans]
MQVIMARLETRRTTLLACGKAHPAVRRTLPFVMRALCVPEERWADGS